MNQRSGGGQGRGQGRGCMGAPQTGAGAGFCICAKCGHREPHQRGVPCIQKQCPKCGAALTTGITQNNGDNVVFTTDTEKDEAGI